MSFTVNETMDGMKGKNTMDGVGAIRVFKVKSTIAITDMTAVVTAPGIPLPRDKYPTNDDIWVTDVVAEPMSSGDNFLFLVTVTYTIIPPFQNTAQTIIYPWDQKDIVEFGSVSKRTIAEKCYGKTDDIELLTPFPANRNTKVVNSVTLAFDPPSYFEERLQTITITRNKKATAFAPSTLPVFENSINSKAITIASIPIPILQGWMAEYKAKQAWHTINTFSTLYYQIRMTFVIDPESWLKRIVDAGLFTEKAATDPVEYVPILDDTGKRILSPVRLNGSGGLAGKASPDHIFNFHCLREKDWGPLSLPTDHKRT